jgi:hypothetical protein
MHQHPWGYKVEEKLYLGVREQKMLNTTVLDNRLTDGGEGVSLTRRPPLTPRKIPGTLLLEAESTPGP